MSSRTTLLALSLLAVAISFAAEKLEATRARETREQLSLLSAVMAATRLDHPSGPHRAAGEGVFEEVLGGLAPTVERLEGLEEEERRRVVSPVVSRLFLEAWKKQLTDECASSSVRLFGKVQPLHPGLATLEETALRGRIPESLSAPSRLRVHGLSVMFAEGSPGGRLCTHLEPSLASIIRAEKPVRTFEEVSKGIWKLETRDGSAASVLLSPEELPKAPGKWVVFVPTADRVVLASASSREAILGAAYLAAESPGRAPGAAPASCVSEHPLVYAGNAWRPWKVPSSMTRSLEWVEFTSASRNCVAEALHRAVGQVRAQRYDTPNPLPSFTFARVDGEKVKVDLREDAPLLVVRSPRVRVTRGESERLELDWEYFAALAGTRLRPLVIDGTEIQDTFLLAAGIAEAEFPFERLSGR